VPPSYRRFRFGWISPTGELHDIREDEEATRRFGSLVSHDLWAESVMHTTAEDLVYGGWIRVAASFCYEFYTPSHEALCALCVVMVDQLVLGGKDPETEIVYVDTPLGTAVSHRPAAEFLDRYAPPEILEWAYLRLGGLA